jgi:hypothetical protein
VPSNQKLHQAIVPLVCFQTKQYVLKEKHKIDMRKGMVEHDFAKE